MNSHNSAVEFGRSTELKPWPHQTEAIERAAGRKGFALFFEPGLGKTFTAIKILEQYARGKGELPRTLVFAPPIVLENWRREFRKFSEFGDEVLVLSGPGQKRIKMLRDSDRKIVVTNYESTLNAELFKVLQKSNFGFLIIDESHYCKSLKADRTKRVTTLSRAVDFCLLLSGTPATSSLLELFTQLRIMDGGETLGTSITAYRNEYFFDAAPYSNFRDWRPDPSKLDELNQKINAAASIKKVADCLDLPPLIKKPVYFDLIEDQRIVYDEMKRDLISYVTNDEACIATTAMTRALRLMEITSGYYATLSKEGETKKVRFTEDPRARALKDTLKELPPDSKVIIWAVFIENYEAIKEVLQDLALNFVELHGSVHHSQRQVAIDAFNHDPSVRVLVGNPKSAGIGCNLTAARYAIFYSRNFSLEQDIQAEKRNHRAGSEEHQTIIRIDLIAKDTIDEVIEERLAEKQAITDKVIREVARTL